MKILLTTLNSKFIHTNLAIRYLNSFCKDLADITVAEYTINNSVDYILKEIYKQKSDIVVFSTYIWNVDDTIKICKNLKKVSPHIKILLGGPEVSYDFEEFMKKYDCIDYIIYGEGELTFREFIEYSLGKKDIDNIDGLVYRKKDSIIVNEPRQLIHDLNIIPSPYENIDKKEYENRIVYYETSRGCPFNCQYCLSSTIKGLRFFDIDRVKMELKNLINANVKQVKFVDRTFNAKKEYALDIMKFIMENDNGFTNFHFEVTAHLIDDDMLEFLSKCSPGLFQFEIGVQSTNKKTLEEVGRTQNFESLSYVVNKISSFKNIHQHLDLIAGLPYENYESFRNSFNTVFNLDIEQLQLGFLKMLKGSGIRKNSEKHDYIFKDYTPYEVLGNKYMSYDEMLKIKDIEEVLEIYYNSNNFKLSMNYIIKKYYSEDAFKLFEDLSSYWEDNGYFKISQGKNQLYKILIDFYTDVIKVDVDIFKDVLKYDYISLGKVSSLPSMFDKMEVDDFKNRCHIFLKSEENVRKYTPKFENTPAKNIIKYVRFEPFNYDVSKLKENIHEKLDKDLNTILFVYDLDKKVFEKSNSYKVVI
ncbi:B12-binding domain-containing radical SAM protein [Tepidibacter aestuarii]|uniref:B12-binding domain-containing radical SAM protein n=1 Tax=Tepidibacter aestuarii TaxID=2925782 RepID=UPI0020C0C494|nr:B12-binding domain-containing radical SAM protein [Tepidibacter aestuarii]CAH2212403.1 anaerobic magnesium-protoporphyrin IX monomethyl ester cyclase [Tepidibacter aestuarii]